MQPASITVLVAVHGALGPLKDCLWALRTNTASPLELVIVDNASDPDTASWLKVGASEFTDAIIVTNEVNVGFGAAMNQAALLARTPYVCFLNSDAFVEKDWDLAMLELLQSSPAVGAVVPMVLEDDGRLQEAGVLLSGDGRTWDHGNGDDPMRPRYLFRRIVDYGSAVCMMVRNCDFMRLGGFDAIFGLGYYEDADLCLRLAEMGLRTVYEPQSKVRHMRGASSQVARALEMIERNRGLFTERWASVLNQRPILERNDFPAHLALHCRDANCNDRLLLLGGPGGPGRGAWIWLALAKAFARQGGSLRVTLALAQGEAVRHLVSQLQADGVEVLHDDQATLIGSRRAHYSIVLGDSELDDEVWNSLAKYQSQAEIVVLARKNSAPSPLSFQHANRIVTTGTDNQAIGAPAGSPLWHWTEDSIRGLLAGGELPAKELASWGLLLQPSLWPTPSRSNL